MTFFQRLGKSSFMFWFDVGLVLFNLYVYAFIPPHSLVSFGCAILMTILAMNRWKYDSLNLGIKQSEEK